MTIGILTFHLAHNYGAVLQCYALQEVIRSMGHDVYVIDYQQPFMVEHFRPKRYWGIRSFISALIHSNLPEYLYRSRLPYVRYHNFENFKQRYFHLTDKCYGTDDIPLMDLYIVGSDQPWNPDLTGGADPVYYGQFHRPEGSSLITYAMSGSEESFSKVGWDKVKLFCESFDALSFREESITNRFEQITGRRCKTVLDPTLIADATLWEPLINNKWANYKYILLYHVGGPKDVIDTMTAKAQQIAKEQGIKFIDASRYLYSPSDFVSLIRYASFVITASFHAMVFSIIFQKQFCVVRTGQASDVRFEALLSNLNAKDHLIEVEDISIENIKQTINVEDMLKKIRQKSLTYIMSKLNVYVHETTV